MKTDLFTYLKSFINFNQASSYFIPDFIKGIN